MYHTEPSSVNPLGCADHVSCRIYSIAMVSQVVSYVTANFVVKINGSTDLDRTFSDVKNVPKHWRTIYSFLMAPYTDIHPS